MTGAITHDRASQLRGAVDEALRVAPEITDSVRAAFARPVDVLGACARCVLSSGKPHPSTASTI